MIAVLFAGCTVPDEPLPANVPAPTASADAAPAAVVQGTPAAEPAPPPAPLPLTPVARKTGLAAMEETGWFGVTLGSYAATVFADTTAPEWEEVAARICADPNGPNVWIPGSAHLPGGADDKLVYLSVWASAAQTRCPTKIDGTARVLNGQTDRLAALSWALQTQTAVMSHYAALLGPLPKPVVIPAIGPGSGYAVMCADGSSSSAGGKQGACSWHGGVAGK